MFADAGVKGYLSKPEIREEERGCSQWNLCRKCVAKYEDSNTSSRIPEDISKRSKMKLSKAKQDRDTNIIFEEMEKTLCGLCMDQVNDW